MDCVPLRQFGTGWHCEPRARLLLLAVEASARSRAREPRDCIVEREVRLERRAAPAFRGSLDLDARWGRGGTPTIPSQLSGELPGRHQSPRPSRRETAAVLGGRDESLARRTPSSSVFEAKYRPLTRAARGIDYKAGGA